MKNYYEILGIEPGSNAEQIKAAYREKARKFHPDTSKCDRVSEFHQIQEAYEILCDRTKRNCYDAQFHEFLVQEKEKNNARMTRVSPKFAGTDWNFIQNDFFSFADREVEENANPKYLEIILSPQEALHGTVVAFDIPFTYTCPFCVGTGELFFHICSQCNGTGKKRVVREFHLKLPAGQKNGSHLTFNLIDSAIFKMRLNVVVKLLNPTTIFSEIF